VTANTYHAIVLEYFNTQEKEYFLLNRGAFVLRVQYFAVVTNQPNGFASLTINIYWIWLLLERSLRNDTFE